MTFICVIVIVSVIVGVLFYLQWSFSYWQRVHIPQVRPFSVGGNLLGIFRRKKSLPLQVADFYHTMRKLGHRHAGYYIFTRPSYVVLDSDYTRNIMSRDFGYFSSRDFYYNERDDPISAHLFAAEGEKWKKLRVRLTPTFTSGKMKTMFSTIVDCTKPMLKRLKQDEHVNIKEIMACYTTDTIGSCAFGVDCNSFEYPDADFRRIGKLICLSRPLKRFFVTAFPDLAKRLRVTVTRPEVESFLRELVEQTVRLRETGSVLRKDFMQILVELKKKNDGLTLDEIAAQVFIFFVGGFETSASTMTHFFFELAKNQALQDEVRKEVRRVLDNTEGRFTYESLSDLKLLEKCIHETLRKYPSVPMLTRVCVKPYRIPDTDITLEKGTKVLIPVYGFHHDPEYFPEPETFDPERFSDARKESIRPYTFLEFGEGPRVCIGVRFAMMQMKIGLGTILNKFRLHIAAGTPDILDFNPHSTIFLSSKQTIYLNVESAD